jgi:hypothetical protein
MCLIDASVKLPHHQTCRVEAHALDLCVRPAIEALCQVRNIYGVPNCPELAAD